MEGVVVVVWVGVVNDLESVVGALHDGGVGGPGERAGVCEAAWMSVSLRVTRLCPTRRSTAINCKSTRQSERGVRAQGKQTYP